MCWDLDVLRVCGIKHEMGFVPFLLYSFIHSLFPLFISQILSVYYFLVGLSLY